MEKETEGMKGIRRFTDKDGNEIMAIEFDGNKPKEEIADAVGRIIKGIKMRRFILDKNFNPQPADEMPEERWKEFMKRFHKMHETRVGKFRIETVFVGIDAIIGESDDPSLFATVLYKGEEKIGVKKAKTVKIASDIHKAAILAVKSEQTRWPWDIVRDRIVNGYWV